MINIKLITIIFIIMLPIDFVWLNLMAPKYNDTVKSIQNDKIRINFTGAIIAYVLIGIGLYNFVFNNIDKDNIQDIIKKSALFGLVSYGIFNGTNHAIFKNWNISTLLIDTTWGVVMCSLVSTITYLLYTKLNN